MDKNVRSKFICGLLSLICAVSFFNLLGLFMFLDDNAPGQSAAIGYVITVGFIVSLLVVVAGFVLGIIALKIKVPEMTGKAKLGKIFGLIGLIISASLVFFIIGLIILQALLKIAFFALLGS